MQRKTECEQSQQQPAKEGEKECGRDNWGKSLIEFGLGHCQRARPLAK